VATAELWLSRRRPEILELFREHVYGRAPVGRPADQQFETTDIDPHAMDGRATRKLVTISFSGPGGAGAIRLVLFLPNDAATRAPCFLLVCHRGMGVIDPARERKLPFWPAEEIVARGCAAAAFSTDDVDPDGDDGFKDGVHGIFDPPGERRPDSWGTLAAWAWGASRVMDYLESDPAIDAARVAVVGHSRGGKTAMWAGAEDTRFALVISNDSGAGGAALARGMRGERIRDSIRVFPYWYCENYRRYADRENELPVDQHMLAALIAPRLLYIASASQDHWADPRGEFLGAVHAEPVYALHGLRGLGGADMPPPGHPVGQSIGYHVRSGEHDLTLTDWTWFLDFAGHKLKSLAH